jgi:8-oxo-dGTP pyrophosphatase MutT (NUDIX family)
MLTASTRRHTVLEIVIARGDRPHVASVGETIMTGAGSEGIPLPPRDPSLRVRLQRHSPSDAKEAADLAEMLAFVDCHADPFDRGIVEGHLTGSAVVVSATGDRVLLLHHRKLRRWLQPGGHAEPGEREGESVALREAREETGIEGLTLHPSAPRPLDVDVHPIPARGNEPAHRHLDLRYLVVAPGDATLRRLASEARALRWFTWEEVGEVDLDPGLRRALRATRALVSLALTPSSREASDDDLRAAEL